MEIGVSVGPVPEDIEEVSRDFDFVEISVGEHEIDLEEIDFDHLKKVLDEKEFNLVIHLPFRQPLATEVSEFNLSVIEYLDRLLMEVQEEVEVGKAVVHANLRDPDSEEELGELEAQITELQRIGTKHSVEMCFENVEHAGTPDLFTLGEILERTDASMCLDIGHAFMNKDEDEVRDFLSEHGELVEHLHIHDIRDRGDSHLSIGDGWIEFEGVCQELQDFEGTACFEIFTDDMDYIELSKEKFLQHF